MFCELLAYWGTEASDLLHEDTIRGKGNLVNTKLYEDRFSLIIFEEGCSMSWLTLVALLWEYSVTQIHLEFF